MPRISSYEHGQFAWVDLTAHDMAAARDFYRRLFGWTCVDLDTHGGPPYAQFEMDGDGVAGLGQMNDKMKAQGVPPMWNSYINVDDIRAVTQRATELGGRVTMPVMKVLEAGWLAFIQDPTGASVGLWQRINHVGAQRVGDVGCLGWNELATRDVDRACEFFAALLGWEHAEHPSSETRYFVAKAGGRETAGIMQIKDEWGEMPPCWCVYFMVDDVDASVQRLEQLGGRVDVAPFDLSVGRMTVVADAQGAYFNLIKMNESPG
jgi:predicted enzyme related to lactoylglutathione lyase